MGVALLVTNPRCLTQRGQTVAGLQQALQGAGVDMAPMSVEPDMPASELAHRAQAVGATTLVAAGGDGTLHMVANAAARAGLTLAVLPFGTANDFARGLALPLDLDAAVAVIARGLTREIDLGSCNGHFFLNAAHLGLGAETARRSDSRLKRLLGPLAYALAAIGAWHESKSLKLSLRADGQAAVIRASQLLVGNGTFYGGGNLVAPDAAIDDGLLDVQVVGPDLPAHALPRLAGALRRGDMAAQPETLCFRTERLEVTLSRPTPVNMDGELEDLGERLIFEVVPRALRVIVAGGGNTTIGEAASDAT